MIWGVGNGNFVQIWGDNWLSTPTTAVQSLIKFLPTNANVSALIDLETKWWNLPFLHSVFSPGGSRGYLLYTSKQIWSVRFAH
jgi:hypothetical protein